MVAPTHLDKLLREGSGAKELFLSGLSFQSLTNSRYGEGDYSIYLHKPNFTGAMTPIHFREVTPLDRAKDEIIEFVWKELVSDPCRCDAFPNAYCRRCQIMGRITEIARKALKEIEQEEKKR